MMPGGKTVAGTMAAADDAGSVVPEKNPVLVSGDYLSRERATHELEVSNVVPVIKRSGSDDFGEELHVHGHGPGTAPDHVYESGMSWWRYRIRRFLVANLHTESRVIAAMQKRVRTPWLDTYFVYTSSLGTHTFFMTLLPAIYFFGAPETGRAIVQVLAAGVYISSLVKDSICSPRPFAPPVTRLTMGSHHLEYGFPSTHSTNSVSMALYLYTLLLQLWHSASSSASAQLISSDSFLSNATSTASTLLYSTQHEVDIPVVLRPGVFPLATLFLCVYAVSIVFGRVYCAMHSYTDCVMGVTLGTAIWAVQVWFGPVFEKWMSTSGWAVPIVVIVLGALMVNQHAEPVDDCPCFEDAIAFVSVVIGTILGQWHGANWGYSIESGYFASRMPGTERRDLQDWMLWSSFAGLKMILGVSIIFTWRILAKSTLHAALPPLFRTLARLFTLPNRRFYTPATDYKGPVPDDEFVEGTSGLLRSIPSVIDIPHMLEEHGEGGASSTALLGLPQFRDVRSRTGAGTPANGAAKAAWAAASAGSSSSASLGVPPSPVAPSSQPARRAETKLQHYDADVITKVIVYAGIGFLASDIIPILFEVLGWGVRP